MKLVKKFMIISLMLMLLLGCEKANNEEPIDISNNNKIIEGSISELQDEINTLQETIHVMLKDYNELLIEIDNLKKMNLILLTNLEDLTSQNQTIPVGDEIVHLSTEEIHEIYQKALKVYSWFKIGTMASDYKDQIIINDMVYCKVTGEITEYEDLINLMGSLFSNEIIDYLLSSKLYINVDGELYSIQADRGTDISKGNESYEIIRQDEGVILYKVIVEILDDNGSVIGYEENDFILKYMNHQWIFEEFHLVR